MTSGPRIVAFATVFALTGISLLMAHEQRPTRISDPQHDYVCKCVQTA